MSKAKLLSATDIANAWYIGMEVKTEIDNVKGLCRSLRKKGLSRKERREVVSNVI